MNGRVRLAAALLLLGCSSPLPTATPTAVAQSSPSPIPTTLPSPTRPTPTADRPSPSPGPAHFSGDGLAFDYPGDWRVIAKAHYGSPVFVLAVVGTGDWSCDGQAGLIDCLTGTPGADPGEVVAEFSYLGSGPVYPVYGVPDFEDPLTANGLAIHLEESPPELTATLFVPGHKELNVRVVWGHEASAAERAVAQRMIESVTYSFAYNQAALVHSKEDGSPGPCATETLVGRLARGIGGRINLVLPAGFESLSWPAGWTASIGDDRRAELYDDSGAFVAREWDEVSIGAREVGRRYSNEYRVCGGEVSVLRAFPLG